jgi:hypothetical protein
MTTGNMGLGVEVPNNVTFDLSNGRCLLNDSMIDADSHVTSNFKDEKSIWLPIKPMRTTMTNGEYRHDYIKGAKKITIDTFRLRYYLRPTGKKFSIISLLFAKPIGEPPDFKRPILTIDKTEVPEKTDLVFKTFPDSDQLERLRKVVFNLENAYVLLWVGIHPVEAEKYTEYFNPDSVISLDYTVKKVG